jgi:AmmeMemoRadiSam system protein A
LNDSFLNAQERAHLLFLARASLERCVCGVEIPSRERMAGRMEEKGAAFATLHKGGRLRGCIGTMTAERPLWETVVAMVERAARHDPRFSPITPEEVDEIEIELSVLTPLVCVDDVEEVEVGRHGLVVERGSARGVLLPQVASERGWDAATFLARTCEKAGLPASASEDPAFQAWVFEAQVFGEVDP